MSAPVILWFRNDLRLGDQRALCAAAECGRPIVPVYVLDDDTPGRWRPGGASRWWLHHSLARLGEAIAALGGRLLLRRGKAAEVLARLCRESGAEALYCSRAYEPHAAALERQLDDALGSRLELRRFRGALLFEPETVRAADGRPFKVFTPFWKACLRRPQPGEPTPVPDTLRFAGAALASEELDDWRLPPRTPDWAGGLREHWTPGEAGAHARLERFIDEALADYRDDRDRPDRRGTSRLSPHLHFGEIGPRQVWHAVRTAVSRGASEDAGAAFLRELGWREFCGHLLHHWPGLPQDNFRVQFDGFPWRNDPDALAAWQKGVTGYPLVDAGMRELWHSGWMHNRVRMVTASFLIKHLLLPWQDGEVWFWDTLVDADLASNAAGWQWVAGSGADAAPYFRIFNPVLQGGKFDPDGAYVRRWVPELARLPAKYIHRPWTAPAAVLEAADVALGESYPRPIVDHQAARARALEAFEGIKRERR